MKKLLTLFVIAFLFSQTVFSQSENDVYSARTITWFGIDYTHCNFISMVDFPNLHDLVDKIRAWNSLVLTERDKYIDKNFPGRNVLLYNDAVNARNDQIKITDHITNDPFKSSHLDDTQVKKIISSYKIPRGKKGIGLVLIAESYSKPNVKGAYYATFFNMATKKVLVTERMLGKPKGFGLRNYWAASINAVLKQLGKKY